MELRTRPTAAIATAAVLAALLGTAPSAARSQTVSPAAPAAAATPAPAAAPSNPPENTIVTERVRSEFLAWQRGHIDRARYSPYAGGTNIDALVTIERPYLAVGAPQTVTYETTSLLLNDLVYRYTVTGESGDAVAVLYSLDQNGKIDGIVFTPQAFRNPSLAQ